MNEQEAKDQCARNAAEHPDRDTHRWIPTKAKDGTWAVAKINLPPVAPPAGTEARTPNSASTQIGPPPGGGFHSRGF